MDNNTGAGPRLGFDAYDRMVNTPLLNPYGAVDNIPPHPDTGPRLGSSAYNIYTGRHNAPAPPPPPSTQLPATPPGRGVRWGKDAVITIPSLEDVAENQINLKKFYNKLKILKEKNDKGEDVTDAVSKVNRAARKMRISSTDPFVVRKIAEALGTVDDTGEEEGDIFVGGKRSRRKSHRRKSHKRKTHRRKSHRHKTHRRKTHRRKHSRHKHSRHKSKTRRR